jgi:hypothetical protein
MKSNRSLIVIVLAAALVLGSCAQPSQKPTAILPAGKAFAEGREIYFVHTEVSDPDIAKLLTNMMASPVLWVPSLVHTPDSALANVYVFDSGLKGTGPLGYQDDVFDNPPGSPGYSPLRRLNVVTWKDPAQARLLKAAAEVLAAREAGEVSIAQPGVVVNMPFVVWDGGKR